MVNFIKKYKNTQVFFLYLFLITILYAPVVLFGKSLQPSLYQPHGVVEGWPYGYKGRKPVNTFNVNLAVAYDDWPLNKLIGDIYRKSQIPLWDPYRACGTPLAAEYSTRAFFPYQMLQNLSPVCAWDYFLLGRLLIAGFFTYLFLRLLRLSFAAAILGGIFFMFSGTMVWFINFEYMTNISMLIPLLLYCIELLVQSKSLKGIALSAVAFGLVLLAGQPEIALYVLLLGAVFFLFRISVGSINIHRSFSNLIRIAFAFLLGFGLAAILIIPFVEYLGYAYHTHPPGGAMGIVDPANGADAVCIFTPTISEVPMDLDYSHGTRFLGKDETSSKIPFYYTIFPTNGVWDYLGGYSGIVAIFLILAGFLVSVFKGYRRWRSYLFFFSSFGLAIVLKNFGVKPFLYLGYLPLFDQVWSQRWAGPTWTFSFAVAGAIGYEIVRGCFSSETPPQLNGSETVERTDKKSKFGSEFIESIKRIYPNNIMKYSFFHALAAWISLRFAYNSYREWTKHIVGIPIEKDVKLTLLAVKTTFPWAIITFVVIYLIISLWKNKKIGFLSLKRYGMVLALQALLVNLLFWSSGKEVLIVQNLALLYLAFVLLLWGIVKRFTFIDTLRSMSEGKRTNIQLPRILNNLLKWREKPYFPIVFAFFVTFGVYLYFVFVSSGKYNKFSFFMRPYFVPSVVIGICISIILLIIATVICVYYVRRRKGLYGLIPLVILELWWAIPRGYSHEWLSLKIIPLMIGLLVVLCIVLERWRFALFGIILFLIAFACVDFKSPNGFPDRYNPFTPAPYVDFLKKQKGCYRVMGGYGVLFPNYASAVGLYDIRYINSLSVGIYQDYRSNCLHKYPISRDTPDALWFTGSPELHIKIENKFAYVPFEHDFKAKLAYYSLLGVKYILVPADKDFNKAFHHLNPDLQFPLIYDEEIRIYENPYVLPRAFVAHGVEYVSNYKKAMEAIAEPNLDIRKQAMIEEMAPEGYKNIKSWSEDAKIKIVEYSSNRVVINASTEHPRILVLTDVFYPGWKVYVDGENTKIYRINGLVRGVFINDGEHRVVFDYFPKSFVLGIIFSLISLLIIGLLFFRNISWGNFGVKN